VPRGAAIAKQRTDCVDHDNDTATSILPSFFLIPFVVDSVASSLSRLEFSPPVTHCYITRYEASRIQHCSVLEVTWLFFLLVVFGTFHPQHRAESSF